MFASCLPLCLKRDVCQLTQVYWSLNFLFTRGGDFLAHAPWRTKKERTRRCLRSPETRCTLWNCFFQSLDSQEILKELWGSSRNPVLLGEPVTAKFRSEPTRGTFRQTLLKRFLEDLLLMSFLEKEKFDSLYLQLVWRLQVSLVFDLSSMQLVQKSCCVRL